MKLATASVMRLEVAISEEVRQDAEEVRGAHAESVRFEDLGLSEVVLRGVRDAGYDEPRPIQAATLPTSLAGRDVLGLARTGTGKTAAFALPILERIAASRRGGEPAGSVPLALVLAPTRELSMQIAGDIRSLGEHVDARVALVIGGVDAERQAAELAGGVDVVVATTGRLLDFVQTGTVDLGGIRVVVLDEADRMIDMGFLPDVRSVLRTVGDERQTMMFSATMPEALQALAQENLRTPEIVDLGHTLPAETIEHHVVLVRGSAKPKLLRVILDGDGATSVMVFVRTRKRAKAVAFALEKRGESVALLHGDKKQGARTRALDAFRRGEARVLVATDLASRGLDVEGVSHVVNYDVPEDPDAYVHRIGRTGRAERRGEAVTFIARGDLGALRAIEHRIGARVDRRLVKGFAALDEDDLSN